MARRIEKRDVGVWAAREGIVGNARLNSESGNWRPS
jgi:hypothetical protein